MYATAPGQLAREPPLRDQQYRALLIAARSYGVLGRLEDSDAVWSSDSSMIAFSDGIDVYTAPRSGGTPVNLTKDRGGGTGPQWSPDGTHIAFTRGDKVWRMAADGSGAVPLKDGV